MTDEADVARYEREQAFHDERYRDDSDRSRAEKFYEAGDASGERYRTLLAEVPPGARVLEYGCGTGSAAFDLAARGVEVLGVDISPVAIGAATREAEDRGLSERAHFQATATSPSWTSTTPTSSRSPRSRCGGMPGRRWSAWPARVALEEAPRWVDVNECPLVR